MVIFQPIRYDKLKLMASTFSAYFIVLFTSFSISCFGQERKSTLIIFEQKNVNEVIRLEKEIDNQYEIISQNVILSEQIFPLLKDYNIGKPLLIKRTAEFLPIYINYFYSMNDSLVRFINYDWERGKYDNFRDKQKIWGEEKGKLEGYNLKYEALKLILKEALGDPNIQDQKPRISKSQFGNKDFYIRETNWETDEFVANLNLTFASKTYRIRYNIYWK